MVDHRFKARVPEDELYFEELGRGVPLQKLIDFMVEEDVMSWYDYVHGFETFSDWQMTALKDTGLEPTDYLLDVGCGPLRLGVQAIAYLDDGHYYGVDAIEGQLEVGRKLADELGIDKDYTLLHSDSFGFDEFGVQFDYAIAQSVFTHLSRPQMEDCIASLADVMEPGGKLLFTYLLRDRPKGKFYADSQPMIEGTLDLEHLEAMAERHGVTFVPTDVEHPTQTVGIMEF